MGISASHASDSRADTAVHGETPAPPLKMTFSTRVGETQPSVESTHLLTPDFTAKRGNLHPGVTQWLLAGEISAQGTEMEKMRGTTGTASGTLCLTPDCMSLSSSTLHTLQGAHSS